MVNAFVEATLGPDARQIRDALSQLQLAYARLSGGQPEGAEGPAAPPAPGEEAAPEEGEGASGAGPAQRSGRLWIPGQ